MKQPTREKRIVVSIALAALTTVSAMLIRARVFHVSSGVGPEPPTWLQYLIRTGYVEAWVLTCLFAILWLVAYSLLVGNRVGYVSKALGVGMTAFAVLGILLRVLPERVNAIIARGVVGEDYFIDHPSSLFQEAPFVALISWVVLVAMCVLAWRVGYWVGLDQHRTEQRTPAWAAAWIMGWLAILITAQSGGTNLAAELAVGIQTWSLWSALAGLFLGWGKQRSEVRSTSSGAAGTDQSGST